MDNIGVSFSVKQCRNFDISSMKCLRWLLDECGFKRYRLMSYWDEIEKAPGTYDFHELDAQIELISKHKGTISLCLGARQPRWPENHWPEWAWNLKKADRSKALIEYLKTVLDRYKSNLNIVSYQLENEALLREFGLRPEIDRRRLRQEFKLVKLLDPSKPVCMSTSTSWGMPIRRPIGDIVGFSYYQIVYNNKKKAYTRAFHKPWLHTVRAKLIKAIWNRESFIHELQLEPWGPKNIWEMSFEEQMKSMNPQQIAENILHANRTGIKPIDLWGAEWWYWCHMKKKNETIISAVLRSLS